MTASSKAIDVTLVLNGEIGIVVTAAAVANAIYHATGKRICDLPITIDRILAAQE